MASQTVRHFLLTRPPAGSPAFTKSTGKATFCGAIKMMEPQKVADDRKNGLVYYPGTKALNIVPEPFIRMPGQSPETRNDSPFRMLVMSFASVHSDTSNLPSVHR